MEKTLSMVSENALEGLTELAKVLGIDVDRYQPVSYENYPFFSIFCVDKENSKPGDELIIKFEILVYDADRIDELLRKFKVNIAIDKNYLDIEDYKIYTISYPQE